MASSIPRPVAASLTTPVSVYGEDGSARDRTGARCSGPGLPENALEEVFAPFFRLERSRGRGFAVGHATAKVLPVKSKSVDAVLFGQVLIHVPPPIAPAIEEAVRVARRYVVLLEETDESAGPGSAATGNAHCFRHDLVGHVRRVAPQAKIHRLESNVHLCAI